MNTDILLGIGIIVVGFLVFRVIFLWYWRVNEIVALLKRIERNTRNKKIEMEVRPPEVEQIEEEPPEEKPIKERPRYRIIG